jgi:putative ABC transport system permease protein
VLRSVLLLIDALSPLAPLDISAGADMSFEVDGYTAQPNEEMQTYYNRIGPNYFDAMGINLVEGRGIIPRDTQDQPLVVVINETMAERYFRGRSAIGGKIRFGRGPATVVGVARSGKHSALNEPDPQPF